MSKPIPDERIEFPLAGGDTFVIATGERSLFEEITNDLLSKAERILGLMKKHVRDDYDNKEFREKWTPPPIPNIQGDFLAAILWVIGHEREQLFAQLTKNSNKSEAVKTRTQKPECTRSSPRRQSTRTPRSNP